MTPMLHPLAAALLLVGCLASSALHAQQCDRAGEMKIKGPAAYRNGVVMQGNSKSDLCFKDKVRTGAKTKASLKLVGNVEATFDHDTLFTVARPSGLEGFLMSIGIVEGRAIVKATNVEVVAGNLSTRLGSEVNFQTDANGTVITVLKGQAVVQGPTPQVIAANQQYVSAADGTSRLYALSKSQAEKTTDWSGAHCGFWCKFAAAVAAGILIHSVTGNDEHETWCCTAARDNEVIRTKDKQCRQQGGRGFATEDLARAACTTSSAPSDGGGVEATPAPPPLETPTDAPAPPPATPETHPAVSHHPWDEPAHVRCCKAGQKTPVDIMPTGCTAAGDVIVDANAAGCNVVN